jgi:hypothetical protein
VTTVTRKNHAHSLSLSFELGLGFGIGAAGFFADFDWVLRKSPAKGSHDIGETFALALSPNK